MEKALPGWHPDPAHIAQFRWWNGNEVDRARVQRGVSDPTRQERWRRLCAHFLLRTLGPLLRLGSSRNSGARGRLLTLGFHAWSGPGSGVADDHHRRLLRRRLETPPV